jgi:hypothetical protein
MASKSIKWTLPLEKETKGTHQYKDPDNRKHMVYVPKDELAKIGNPDEIVVTITAKEE